MSFVDKVNNTRDGVLSRPEYKGPIMSVFARANAYTSELKLEEKLAKGDEEVEVLEK